MKIIYKLLRNYYWNKQARCFDETKREEYLSKCLKYKTKYEERKIQ
jgi:hypothetical protein